MRAYGPRSGPFRLARRQPELGRPGKLVRSSPAPTLGRVRAVLPSVGPRRQRRRAATAGRSHSARLSALPRARRRRSGAGTASRTGSLQNNDSRRAPSLRGSPASSARPGARASSGIPPESRSRVNSRRSGAGTASRTGSLQNNDSRRAPSLRGSPGGAEGHRGHRPGSARRRAGRVGRGAGRQVASARAGLRASQGPEGAADGAERDAVAEKRAVLEKHSLGCLCGQQQSR